MGMYCLTRQDLEVSKHYWKTAKPTKPIKECQQLGIVPLNPDTNTMVTEAPTVKSFTRATNNSDASGGKSSILDNLHPE